MDFYLFYKINHVHAIERQFIETVLQFLNHNYQLFLTDGLSIEEDRQLNQLRHKLAVGVGRLCVMLLRAMGRQASTLPGQISLRVAGGALADQARGVHVLLVSGTNGKTTTTSILVRLLEQALPAGTKIHSNEYGANMANGMMTALLAAKPGDYAVLECDEAAFAKHAGSLEPETIVLTNIFRDQLDRYGELDTVLRLLKKGCEDSGTKAKLVLCADDPLVASIAKTASGDALFFGLDEAQFETDETLYSGDSAHCPLCDQTLDYKGRSMSHLGDYHCPDCDYGRPKSDLVFRRDLDSRELLMMFESSVLAPRQIRTTMPLDGLYNAYNVAAASLVLETVVPSFSDAALQAGLVAVRPAFGRLERIPYEGKEVCFVLVKNPAGMEQGLRLITEAADVGSVIFFLNNRVNDGIDVSWIWDAPFEQFRMPDVPLGASGERGGDMALRLDYAYGPEQAVIASDDQISLVLQFLADCPLGKTVYLLPNYSAMMELRGQLAEHLGYQRIVSKEKIHGQ